MCINAIWYSLNDQDALNSIQIEFTNGFKTPPFMSKDCMVDRESDSVIGASRIWINPDTRIRKIGLLIYDCDRYAGIRFHGKNNQLIAQKVWKNTSAAWSTYSVPAG